MTAHAQPVTIDTINQLRREGNDYQAAVLLAGFRQDCDRQQERERQQATAQVRRERSRRATIAYHAKRQRSLCTWNGCERSTIGRKYCEHHRKQYNRWARTRRRDRA